MSYLILISTIMVIIAGLIVIKTGSWDSMGLKYAAVIMATFSSVFLILQFPVSPVVHIAGNESTIISSGIIYLFRNMAMLCFIIACGRDAMGMKRGDRRRDNTIELTAQKKQRAL